MRTTPYPSCLGDAEENSQNYSKKYSIRSRSHYISKIGWRDEIGHWDKEDFTGMKYIIPWVFKCHDTLEELYQFSEGSQNILTLWIVLQEVCVHIVHVYTYTWLLLNESRKREISLASR